MHLVSVVLIYTLCLLASCSGGSPEEQHQAVTAKADAESRLDEKGTRYLIASLASYYKLKDALVETNAANADAAARVLANNTDSLWDPILFNLQDGDQTQTLFFHLGTIKANIKGMTGMMDESCEKKRIYFAAISDDLYKVITLCKLKNITIYRQYCPGAFNDKGAYWLSKDKEIRNPYFGQKMLEYGEIVEVIQ